MVEQDKTSLRTIVFYFLYNVGWIRLKIAGAHLQNFMADSSFLASKQNFILFFFIIFHQILAFRCRCRMWDKMADIMHQPIDLLVQKM